MASLVGDHDMVVCVGSGGVGKTTVAAALALGAAQRGQRALVMTIDPARRLADALGIEELGNEPLEIPVATRTSADCPGRLHAMMLDTKQTFDDMVERFSESAEAKSRILENPIYQHLSTALAGSAEYAAMEKVFELHESGRFDVIVVDTPPSQHALDFLDTPRRLAGFLESRIAQLLLRPALGVGGFGLRVFARGSQRFLGLLESVSGVTFLEDLSEFLVVFESMAAGFLARAEQVEDLLLGTQTGFLLVSGPGVQVVKHTEGLLEQLDAARVPVLGLALNRVRTWPNGGSPPRALLEPGCLEEENALLARALGSDGERAGKAAIAMARGYASQVIQDERNTAPLRAQAERRGLFVRCVPEFEQDVHDLLELDRLRAYLFEEEGLQTSSPGRA
jgi:anion-transporting  ArsA/GET3 family ATPase